MAFYGMTMVSRNKKTGPIPVVTASRDTCPSDCPLMKKGCYADGGPLAIVWDRLNTAGLSFNELLGKVRKLPRGQLWRYGQAGDLPAEPEQVLDLARATQGRKVIAYTHRRDVETYRKAADLGMTINLSASSIEEADTLAETGLPVVVVLPSDYERQKEETVREFRDRLGGSLSFETDGGHRVAICPATYLDETSCSTCQACAKPRNGTIIGFPAHGARKRKLDEREVTRRLKPCLKTERPSSSSQV